MAAIPTIPTLQTPTDLFMLDRIKTAPIVGNPAEGFSGMNIRGGTGPTQIPSGSSQFSSNVLDSDLPAGAVRPKLTPAIAIVGNTEKTDLRVRIKVPSSYLSKYTRAGKPQLGIIFPYTPQISLEHKADYTPQTPLHSNYALNFYKSSSVSDISIQGVFTAQNDNDALSYLSTIHLLRALTKGRFGGSDPFRGSPPPICRLWAYGNFMLNNVPVSITSFKQDLTPDVDYYYLSKTAPGNVFGEAMVPVKCTISVVCKPMYSRAEMLDNTVPNWLSGSRNLGIL